MKQLIANFPGQLEEALEIAEKAKLSSKGNIQNVLICGLGGSGIGGGIAFDTVGFESKIPVQISKDYFIPSWVSSNTLCIVSSYSGNTEETLSAFKLAYDRQAMITCITSGGQVLDTAQKQNLDHIVIPGGMPPRACLGYSLVQLYHILNFHGIISGNYAAHLRNAIVRLNDEQESIKSQAEEIASRLHGKIPVIYCSASCESLAVRFRQQLNENSKILAWHHVFPELNHNEIMGWKDKYDNVAAIFLRNDTDFERTQSRMEITKEIITNKAGEIIEIYSRGNSPVEKAIYLIHLCDWISWYLSDLRGMDAMEIDAINHLKGELAKLG